MCCDFRVRFVACWLFLPVDVVLCVTVVGILELVNSGKAFTVAWCRGESKLGKKHVFCVCATLSLILLAKSSARIVSLCGSGGRFQRICQENSL